MKNTLKNTVRKLGRNTKRTVRSLGIAGLLTASALPIFSPRSACAQDTVNSSYSQASLQTTSVPEKQERETFTRRGLTEQEVSEVISEYGNWCAHAGIESGDLEVSRVISSKHPEEKIYFVETNKDASLPEGITIEKTRDIYLLDRGFKRSAWDAYTAIIPNTKENLEEYYSKVPGAKEQDILRRREFADWLSLDYSQEENREKFQKHYTGEIFGEEGVTGRIEDVLLDERQNKKDREKNGLDTQDIELRGLCLRILHGKTLNNLGEAYLIARTNWLEGNYGKYKDFIEYFEREKGTVSLGEIAPKRIREITRKYIQEKYPNLPLE